MMIFPLVYALGLLQRLLGPRMTSGQTPDDLLIDAGRMARRGDWECALRLYDQLAANATYENAGYAKDRANEIRHARGLTRTGRA